MSAQGAGRLAVLGRGFTVDSRSVAIAIVLALLAYLVLGPFLMLILSSFKLTENALPFSEGVPWTLQNYADVFLSPGTYRLLANTLVFSLSSLVLSFSFAAGLAWLTERTNLPFRNALFVLIVASVGVPNVVLGIAWELLLNPVNGLFNIVIRSLGLGTGFDIFTLPGLILVQGLSLVPITYLLIAAAFRAMDVSLEDAGATSGASYRTVIRRVTLPLLTPALLSAFIYQFVTVVESFDIPLIIGLRAGIPVLSTQVYLEVKPPGGLPDYGVASTYGLFLLALAVVPLFFYNRVLGRSERYATITGRGFQPRRIDLGRWKPVAIAFAFGFILFSFVIPVLIMVWASLLPFYRVPSAEALRLVSLDAYAELFASPGFHKAALNTVILGVATGLGTLVLSTLVSWIIVRTRSRLRFPLDVLAFLPHAMPGVIIGLSVLLIYLILPLPVYNTIWIVVIALTTQSVALATRLMSSSIAQLKLELEEASATSGGSWFATMRRVVAPLILPAFLNGFLLVFLSAVKNLTLALILVSSQNVVLSTLIYSFWDNANTAGTAAVGTVLVGITLVASILLRLYGRPERFAV
jgi:iron(III) transport system permease protein